MSDDGELPLVRRSGKSDSAFRTISEVADELDVPQHVLRFWESKFPQVKPLKRGGGRRYYRPEDVALLRRIRDLLYSEGYTIKGVQKLLREGGAREITGALRPEIDGPSPSGTEDSAPSEDDRTDEAELPLGLEDEPDFSDLNDGEEDDVAAAADARAVQSTPVAARPQAAFSAETRQELQAILAELEHLRGLLQPR